MKNWWDEFHNFRDSYGFRDVEVHPLLEAPYFGLQINEARIRYTDSLTCLTHGHHILQVRDSLETVHHRHIYVDKVNEVPVVAALVARVLYLGFCELNCLVAVKRDIYFGLESSIDDGLQSQNIEVFIINDQDFRAALLR